MIFKIAIKHAKEEYVEKEKINWNYIKGDVQKINEAWNNLVLDLTEVSVANDDILGFSNDLNSLFISISSQNDAAMLDKLNDLYAKIIIFKQAYSDDKNKIEKNKIKSDVLGAYTLANKNDYASAEAKMVVTISNYKNLMNDISYAEENGYHLNKVYVLLEELENSLQTQNFDLVRMKYILAVEEL